MIRWISNNAKLKSLTIDEYQISFSPSVTNYSVIVGEDVNDFVESLNSLSNENQEELLSQIENSMTQDQLDLLKET